MYLFTNSFWLVSTLYQASEERNQIAKERNHATLRIAQALENTSTQDSLAPERWKVLDDNLMQAHTNLHKLKNMGYDSDDTAVAVVKEDIVMWTAEKASFRSALTARSTNVVAPSTTHGFVIPQGSGVKQRRAKEINISSDDDEDESSEE